MLIEKILNFLKTNKKTLFYIAFIAVFFMISTDGVFATEGAETTWKSESTDLYNALIQTVSTGIGMLSSIVGLFLNPSWTNGTGIWLHVHLKDLWIMISNIVYVIFAFLLIIIAFMNIIWKWDKWELKQALPKFFIWVLIVPFSWMFVQVVIAISSFLSVSVLMLPYDVLSNSPTNSWEEIKAKPVCTTYIVVSKSQGKDQSANTANTSWCGGTTPIAELLKSDGVYGLLNIYTYGIFSLDQLSQINGQEVDSFTSLFKIGINLIVILLFAIIYFILMVSLCLALFVRWMWLWMYMIFSPVFGLLYFFDKSKDWFIEGKFSISEFVSLAMVPVYVSAALAFGLLFIFVAGWSFGDNPDTDWFVDYKEKPVTSSDYPGTSSGAEISKEAWNGQRITILKNFNLDMYGDFVTSWKQTDGLFDVMKSGFGTLLMQLFGLAVLWVAVMAAINQSKITQAVVEPIASFGKQVGGLIQKSPQYAPIFGGQSMTSLKNASGTYAWSFQTAQSNKGAELAWKLPFSNMWGWNEEIVKLWNKVSWTYEEVLPILDQLRSKWTLEEMVTNWHSVEAIKKQLKQYVEKGWVRNQAAAMEKINKIRVNDIESMKDAWDHIDWDATHSAKSVLWGTVRATSAEIPDYFGSSAQSTNSWRNIGEVLKVQDVSDNSVKLWTVLLKIEDGEIKDKWDYEKIAIELVDTNSIGWFDRNDFDKAFRRMWISDADKRDAILDGVASYIEKDSETWEVKVVSQWDWNITRNDLFKEDDTSN